MTKWHVSEKTKDQIVSTTGTLIAKVWFGPRGPASFKESISNAAILAAAPDLLDACELALKSIKENADQGQAWVALENAIKKAKGDSL